MPRHQIVDESDTEAPASPRRWANLVVWVVVAGMSVLSFMTMVMGNQLPSPVLMAFVLALFALLAAILLLAPFVLVHLYRQDQAAWTDDGRPPPVLPALGRGLGAVCRLPVRLVCWCYRVPAEVRNAAREIAQPMNDVLQRCGDTVEEIILDCRPAAAPEGTFPSPDDNAPLTPLDRARFLAALQDRFAVAVVQIADAVERARTVRELAQYNAQVGAVLGGLHEEVLREIVRQQPAEPPSRPVEPMPRRRRRRVEQAQEFPGAWARKYRGMRMAER